MSDQKAFPITENKNQDPIDQSQQIDMILNKVMDEFEKDINQSQVNNSLLCSYMEKFESEQFSNKDYDDEQLLLEYLKNISS